MGQARTQVYFLPADGSVTRAFRTGVSLHSHTEHSRERLGDLPRYLERMPVVAQFLQWERNRHREGTGRTLDFSRAYWRGPLCAHSAHDVERLQIERLGLRSIVSLTGHGTIQAGMLLQPGHATGEIPVSVEWTVPYEQAYFHLGIHNLDPVHASSWMQALSEYTRAPKPAEPGPTASPGIVFWTTCSTHIKQASVAWPRRRWPRVEGGYATGCELPRANLGSSDSKSPETTNWADTGSAPGLLEDFL